MKRTLITACIAIGVIAFAISSVGMRVATPSRVAGFTNFQQAACDQYHPLDCLGPPPVVPGVPPAVNGNTANAATNAATPTAGQVGGTEAGAIPVGRTGVAGEGTQGARVAAANTQAVTLHARGQLPFTGLSLGSLILLAMALAALGLFARAGERALQRRRRRSPA